MPQNEQTASDVAALLARIDSALTRGEQAAAHLDDRQRRLRQAARSALDVIDRLIDSMPEEADG